MKNMIKNVLITGLLLAPVFLFLTFIFFFDLLGMGEALISKIQNALIHKSLALLFSRLLGWDGLIITALAVLSAAAGESWSMMMAPPGVEGGSGAGSSHLPDLNLPPGSSDEEADLKHPITPKPEAPEPQVYQPLIDDKTRRAELEITGTIFFYKLTEDLDRSDIIDSQLEIEKTIEKELLSDGFCRKDLNDPSTRKEIREI